MHKEHILAKPSALINSEHKLSALRIRILNALLVLASEAQRSGRIDLFEEDNYIYHFSCHTKEVMNVLGKTTNYSFYKNTIRNLQYEFNLNVRNTDKSKRTKEFIQKSGEGRAPESIPVFSSLCVDDKGNITVNLNKKQAEWLLMPAPFAKISVSKESPLVHKGSVVLYELFEDIFRNEYKQESGRNTIEVSVSELKKLLGLKSDYKYSNIKTRHLLPSIKEIKDKLVNLQVSFQERYRNEVIRRGEIVSQGNSVEYIKLIYEYQRETVKNTDNSSLLINIDIPQEIYLLINGFPEKMRGGLIYTLRTKNYLLYEKRQLIDTLKQVLYLYNKGIAKSPIGLLAKLMKKDITPAPVNPNGFKDKFGFYKHFKQTIIAPAINHMANTKQWSSVELKDLYQNIGMRLHKTESGKNKLFLDFRQVHLKDWAIIESLDVHLCSTSKHMSGFIIDFFNSYYKEEFKQMYKDKFEFHTLKSVCTLPDESELVENMALELLNLKNMVELKNRNEKLDTAAIFETFFKERSELLLQAQTIRAKETSIQTILDDEIPYCS